MHSSSRLFLCYATRRMRRDETRKGSCREQRKEEEKKEREPSQEIWRWKLDSDNCKVSLYNHPAYLLSSLALLHYSEQDTIACFGHAQGHMEIGRHAVTASYKLAACTLQLCSRTRISTDRPTDRLSGLKSAGDTGCALEG